MKRTRLFTFFTASIILILLLPLLVGCATKNPAQPAEIPDGWEVVSAEDNVTHIRMKAGEEAQVWLDSEGDSFHINAVLPGGKTYATQTYGPDQAVEVIVYYGYGWIVYDADQGLNHLSPIPDPSHGTSHQLVMEVGNGSSKMLVSLPDFTEAPSVAYDDNKGKIGYTSAVIVKLPAEIFENSTDTCVRFRLLSSQNAFRRTDALYFTHNAQENTLLAETDQYAWEMVRDNSFPRVLLKLFTFEGALYVGNAILTVSAIVLAVLTALKQKRKYLPYLLLLAAITYNYLLGILNGVLHSNAWDSSILMLYIALYYYVPLIIGVAILQIIVNRFIRRRQSAARETDSTASEKPDSDASSE